MMTNQHNALRIFAFADEASQSMAGQIAAMQRNHLQGLEIRGVDGQNVADITLDKARQVRRMLDDAGLRVWSIGSPIGKISIDQEDFAAHLDKLRHTLALAAILGTENVRMFSFYLPENDDPAQYRQQVLDRMGEMLHVAAGAGVTLCHENEKGIYGDNALRCRDLLDVFPDLAGIFDPANFVQCGQDTWAAWTLLEDRIRYLHIKDALQDGSVVPAGMGTGNIRRILAAFRARGGNTVTMEPHLQEFAGLQGLEREGEKSVVGQIRYADSDAAFDAACAAFRACM